MAKITHTALHAAFLHAMTRFEVGFKSQIAGDKNQFIAAAAARYVEHNGTINFSDLLDRHRTKILTTLKSHYTKIIPAFGALAISQIHSRQMKDNEEDQMFSDLVHEWIHTEGLKRAHQISDTTEADVLAAIDEGVANGDGIAAIGRAIVAVSDMSDWRSELIARTETHAAANYGSIESARGASDKLGISLLKTWLPTIDGRTRESHAVMDGSDPIAIDEPFVVEGQELDRPGDPAGSPDNVINCRCTVGYEEDGRENN